jgi:hypothetical protein
MDYTSHGGFLLVIVATIPKSNMLIISSKTHPPSKCDSYTYQHHHSSSHFSTPRVPYFENITHEHLKTLGVNRQAPTHAAFTATPSQPGPRDLSCMRAVSVSVDVPTYRHNLLNAAAQPQAQPPPAQNVCGFACLTCQ